MNKISEITFVIISWASLIFGVLFFVIGIYLIFYVFSWITARPPEFLIYWLPELPNLAIRDHFLEKVLLFLPLLLGGIALLFLSRYSGGHLFKKRADEIEYERGWRGYNRVWFSPTVRILLAALLVILLVILAEYLLKVEFSLISFDTTTF